MRVRVISLLNCNRFSQGPRKFYGWSFWKGTPESGGVNLFTPFFMRAYFLGLNVPQRVMDYFFYKESEHRLKNFLIRLVNTIAEEKKKVYLFYDYDYGYVFSWSMNWGQLVLLLYLLPQSISKKLSFYEVLFKALNVNWH